MGSFPLNMNQDIGNKGKSKQWKAKKQQAVSFPKNALRNMTNDSLPKNTPIVELKMTEGKENQSPIIPESE